MTVNPCVSAVIALGQSWSNPIAFRMAIPHSKLWKLMTKLIYENVMVDPTFLVNFINLTADFVFWFSSVIDSVKRLFITVNVCIPLKSRFEKTS